MISDDMITIASAARMLNLTPQRVRQLLKQGRICWQPTPYGKVVSRASLLAYSETRRPAVEPR